MRTISLLEFRPDLDIEVTPPSHYLERTNGSLPNAPSRLLTDSNGFMVSPRPDRPGDTRVLLLGNSTAENLFIADEMRILARLEVHAADRGVPVKCFSAAASNVHLLHAFNIMLNKGLALRPDIVVLYPTMSFDLQAEALPGTFWHATFAPIRVENAPPPVPCMTETLDFADTQRLLQAFCGLCRAFGIRLFLATWPMYGAYDAFMKHHLPDRAAFEREHGLMISYNDMLRAEATRNGCPLIGLDEQFVGRDHHLYFYDWAHPNATGCDAIAAMTADRLVQA